MVADSPAAVAPRPPDRHLHGLPRAPAARRRYRSPARTSPRSAPTPPASRSWTREILRAAALVLADSRRQCEKLGELQHAPDSGAARSKSASSAQRPSPSIPAAITVADFTGLGVEDLYIAEYCYERGSC